MLQIEDFWENRVYADAQNLFIKELSDFYYLNLETKLSMKLNVKGYEFIARLLMSKYHKLREGVDSIKNKSNRMVVEGLIVGRQRIFQSWVFCFVTRS